MKLSTIGTVVGLALAVPALGGIAWSAFEFRQEVAANTDYPTIQTWTWERMDATRKVRRLSQAEWVKWCWAGRELNIFTVCPPR